jgi:preprotein translocase subunit SecY
MSVWNSIISNLPEVAGPTQKRLSFKEKLKWTLLILCLFFVLGIIPLFGLGQNALENFEFLSIILGAEFGSIISLGIGPIVTASIILQLLNGAGIIKFDLTTHDGKRNFQGTQKLLSLFFIFFEACIYVFMGGLAPGLEFQGTALFLQLQLILIFQLAMGGILIMFMDEIISKWGFGSGISLFIAAGVSKTIFLRAFSFLPSPSNPNLFAGAIPGLFQALVQNKPTDAALLLGSIIATLLVFAIAVFVQAMKVEIPLSFGRIRGQGMRWPLSFVYANVIPVILVSALLANFQLWARLLERWGHPWLGTFANNAPATGFISWINPPNLVEKVLKGTMTFPDIGQAFLYMLIMMGGCMLFSVFWVQTSGMDAKSQAKQIMASGLQIPGFRKDPRIMERLLARYIGPLTVMGGAAIGFLSAVADLSGALTQGTAILLTVMIVYKLYEEIAKQHMYDMHPMMRKFMEI